MGKISINNLIEDTYAEAFSGIFCRVIVTADDEQTVRRAAEDSTATPSVVIGRLEGGVEKWLNKEETPDGRPGAVLQFWGGLNPKKRFSDSLRKFETEFSYRIRQDILVKPFTAVFDALPNAEGKLDMMNRVGHCGDGYEWVENRSRKRGHCSSAYDSGLCNRTVFGLLQRCYGRQFLGHVQNKESSAEKQAKEPWKPYTKQTA